MIYILAGKRERTKHSGIGLRQGEGLFIKALPGSVAQGKRETISHVKKEELWRAGRFPVEQEG